jgi:flotillin
MEEIFKERKVFKEHVLKQITEELAQFGMVIYNANVKQLQDTPGSEYFKYLRLKAQEGAVNKAKVDVAKARMLGTVGEKERQGETRKLISKIESDTIVFEQQRQVDIAKANTEMKTMEAQFKTAINLANIDLEKKSKMREAELQQLIEDKKALVAQERERAERMSKATVEAGISNINIRNDAGISRCRVLQGQNNGRCSPIPRNEGGRSGTYNV